MKKFLSMLLVLCMVVTTLMGTMVMDVSAVDFTRDPDTKEITLAFGTPTLPNELKAWNSFSVGNWYGHGYTYAESDIDAFFAGTATEITGTATEKVNYLETAVVDNALDPITGQMTKYDFKHSTVTDGSKAALDYASGKSYDTTKLFTQSSSAGKISPNYNRLSVFPQPLGSSSAKSYSFGSITKAQIDATATDNTAYVFTFYAYTQNVDASRSGSSINFELRNPNSSISINAADLVSENGVPHKVDIVLASDGNATTPKHRAHLYIDGVDKTAKAYTTGSTDIAFQPRFELNSLVSNGTMNFGETDWYITQFNAKTNFVSTPRADVNAALINVPNYTNINIATDYRTDDYITGVIDSLDADIKAVLETTEVGDKIVDIYESNYNNPASLYTDTENTTVKLISRTTGDEAAVAGATGTMDDYYFMVNGVYVIPNKVDDPLPYAVVSGKSVAPNKTTVDGYNGTRTRIQSYVSSSIAEGEDAYGGLRTGFVKYTAEPRGTFTISSGALYYDQSAYIALNGVGRYKKADYLTEHITKPILTAQFDLFVPEYIATNSSKVKIAVNGNTNEKTTGNSVNDYRADMGDIVFTTNGKTSGTVNGNIVDVVGNAWNTIGIQFDTSEVATKGYKVTLYVNGEVAKTYYTGNITGDDGASTLSDGVGTTNIAWINYMRMYWPNYTSIGIMNDKWVVGEYTPGVTDTTKLAIDDTIDGVTAYDESNLVTYDSNVYATEDALISTMAAKGYEAVYEYETNFSGIDAAYDAKDGSVTTKSGLTYKNSHIKRWIENSGYFTVSGDGENTVYTKKSADELTTTVQKDNVGYITSATWESDTEATLVVTNKFTDQTVYADVCSTFDEICAANPSLRTKKLIGFAVNETGLLPRVYTLQGAGTELYSLAYDAASKVATLTYREFGGTENIPLMMIVAAYDAKGKLLDLDASETITIDVSKEDGVKTETFTADFGELDLTTVKTYKIFVFDSLTTSVPLMASSGVVNSAYVAPVE